MRIVTAYIRPPGGRTDEHEYFDRFDHLARTDLPITAFVPYACASDAAWRWPRVDWITFDFEHLPLASAPCLCKPVLPKIRNKEKDTREYLIIQNSKTLFLDWVARRAGSPRLAWVDFGVAHVLKTPADTLDRLRYMDSLPVGVHIPGCHTTGLRTYDMVDWRFCGGVVVTDPVSALGFHKICHGLVLASPALTWEVNIWSLLDSAGKFKINWYKADHNDSLFDFLHAPAAAEGAGGDGVRAAEGEACHAVDLSPAWPPSR